MSVNCESISVSLHFPPLTFSVCIFTRVSDPISQNSFIRTHKERSKQASVLWQALCLQSRLQLTSPLLLLLSDWESLEWSDSGNALFRISAKFGPPSGPPSRESSAKKNRVKNILKFLSSYFSSSSSNFGHQAISICFHFLKDIKLFSYKTGLKYFTCKQSLYLVNVAFEKWYSCFDSWKDWRWRNIGFIFWVKKPFLSGEIKFECTCLQITMFNWKTEAKVQLGRGIKVVKGQKCQCK